MPPLFSKLWAVEMEESTQAAAARYHNQPKSHPGTNDPTAPLRNLCCSKPAPCRGAPGIPPELRSTRLRRCCATGPAGRPNPGGVSPRLRPCASGKPVPFPGSGPGRTAAGSSSCGSCRPSSHSGAARVARGLAPNSGADGVGPSARAAMGSVRSRSPRGWSALGDIGSGTCPAGPAPPPPRPVPS